MVRQKM